MVICAVLVAAAIGAGTALAMRHNNSGTIGTGTTAVVQGRAPATDLSGTLMASSGPRLADRRGYPGPLGPHRPACH